ncbi:unnamed protein product [Colias eurytheme]|nr:unnamed protein product [Colias eurytheme]
MDESLDPDHEGLEYHRVEVPPQLVKPFVNAIRFYDEDAKDVYLEVPIGGGEYEMQEVPKKLIPSFLGALREYRLV